MYYLFKHYYLFIINKFYYLFILSEGSLQDRLGRQGRHGEEQGVLEEREQG